MTIVDSAKHITGLLRFDFLYFFISFSREGLLVFRGEINTVAFVVKRHMLLRLICSRQLLDLNTVLSQIDGELAANVDGICSFLTGRRVFRLPLLPCSVQLEQFEDSDSFNASWVILVFH